MTQQTQWIRVTKVNPCPICKKPDWCGVSADGEVAICMRVESTMPSRNGGWMHGVRDELATKRFREVRKKPDPKPNRTPREWDDVANGFVERAAHIKMFANSLGVSIHSLKALRAGFVNNRTWAFPMVDAYTGKTCGIRLRTTDGRKLSMRGSKAGLFIPVAMDDPDPIFIAEGPTDTAALLSAGVYAIGRSSCLGQEQMVARFCEKRPVVIMADVDGPGRKGAAKLAQALKWHALSVRIMAPHEKTKDVREWIHRGGITRDFLMAVADNIIEER